MPTKITIAAKLHEIHMIELMDGWTALAAKPIADALKHFLINTPSQTCFEKTANVNPPAAIRLAIAFSK